MRGEFVFIPRAGKEPAVIFMALASLDPEVAEQVAQQDPVTYDFVSGPLCLAMLGAAGLRLLAKDRAENPE